jgi:hypothetical protein
MDDAPSVVTGVVVRRPRRDVTARAYPKRAKLKTNVSTHTDNIPETWCGLTMQVLSVNKTGWL